MDLKGLFHSPWSFFPNWYKVHTKISAGSDNFTNSELITAFILHLHFDCGKFWKKEWKGYWNHFINFSAIELNTFKE